MRRRSRCLPGKSGEASSSVASSTARLAILSISASSSSYSPGSAPGDGALETVGALPEAGRLLLDMIECARNKLKNRRGGHCNKSASLCSARALLEPCLCTAGSGPQLSRHSFLARSTRHEHQPRRNHRRHRQRIQTALNRTGLLLQITEGGRRKETAEVTDGIDQRDHRSGDACIQIGLRNRPERGRRRLEAVTGETDRHKRKHGTARG